MKLCVKHTSIWGSSFSFFLLLTECISCLVLCASTLKFIFINLINVYPLIYSWVRVLQLIALELIYVLHLIPSVTYGMYCSSGFMWFNSEVYLYLLFSSLLSETVGELIAFELINVLYLIFIYWYRMMNLNYLSIFFSLLYMRFLSRSISSPTASILHFPWTITTFMEHWYLRVSVHIQLLIIIIIIYLWNNKTFMMLGSLWYLRVSVYIKLELLLSSLTEVL